MPRIHPNQTALLSLIEGSESDSRSTLEHLLDCPSCQKKVKGLLHPSPVRQTQALSPFVLTTGALPDYDSCLNFDVDELRRRHQTFRQERTEAAALLSELMEATPEQQVALVEKDPRFSTWGALEALLDRSREESFEKPQRAERLGALALALADRLDDDYYGSDRIEDMRARAWASIANARRVRSDLQGAEEAFQLAFALLRDGTEDLFERAFLLDLKASLRRDQRRFDDAKRLLRRAVSIFSDLGEKHRAGRCLVNLSTVHSCAGEPEQAIPLLSDAVRWIDPMQEPRLLVCVRHNLIDFLASAGRFQEARDLFLEARALYNQFPDAWIQNRRHWVKGRIALGLGQLEEAETEMLVARDGFLAEGIPYDTALVSLELACLYAGQGRTDELRRLAGEVVPVFQSRQIHREALAALLCFKQAVEAEEVTFGLVREIATYLKRAEHDPSLRFEAPAFQALTA